MNRKVDLHLHTIASDGSWTPREAVLAAKKAGLGIMAVTDHDSLGSVAPVMKLAPKEGIEVIAGVEMCSTYEGRCFHILGYGFDCSNPILLAHLAHNRRLLEETDERAIAYQTLDMTIRHAKGQMDSLWTVATGDRRNLLTVTSYAVTVPLAYIYVPAVYLIYVLTAFLWIFPEVEGHAS